MKNRILSFISICLVASLVVGSGSNVYANVESVNVTEGSGKSPTIEVIRSDEGLPEEDSYSTIEEGMLSSISQNDIDYMTEISISTVDDLEELAKRCRLDTWSRDKYVVLANDIVIDGTDDFKYIPTFGGIFDGKGHTISGITVSEGESYIGLFCETQASAYIMNLRVEGSMIPSGKQVATGGIVGDNYGIVSNCTFSGNLDGYDYTGGIAGYNELTGQITGCTSEGYIKGMHYTGGIAGYNLGLINGCTNNCKINFSSIDDTVSISDLDASAYAASLFSLNNSSEKDSTSVLNSYVDTGGICGYSSGTIVSCVNNELVGYEHVGYNVGGIVGRQNGYVEMCSNRGIVYGRKDVGGIVGQAEPYVVIDLTDDIIGQLTDNMNTLHDLVSTTLKDAGNESNLITGRLNVVKNFTDMALTDTSYLANETQTYINGVADAGNKALDKVESALKQSTKSGGVFEETKSAVSDAKKSAENLNKTVQDLNIYSYMSDEEKDRYNTSRSNIDKASEDYSKYYDEFYNSDYKYNYYKYINKHHKDDTYYGVSSNLIPRDGEDNNLSWPDSVIEEKSAYESISKIVHYDESGESVTVDDFPSTKEDYASKDNSLNAAAVAYGNSQVETLASAKFSAEYGKDYTVYLKENAETMAEIVAVHEGEMSDATRADASNAIGNVKDTMGHLENAVGETKSIVDNINARGNIVIPTLSDEYRTRSNSLVANIQGMSDNLGLLNNEMNSSNQQLVSDMSDVNDQFNVIMLLIADAIDGALDMDYSTVYEDNSMLVAEECTDATIADSANYGSVNGDINSAGIAGTMAIEYDFDMESDITGIKDATSGTTYKTKCVLRKNRNEGRVDGVKSYVGGIVGLQEMGTVLRCQNYGRLSSSSGDYVGGISGKSLSSIRSCDAKGILFGGKYVGGIAGKGYDIWDCKALPNIEEAESYFGAIAGDNDAEGRLANNYFVSDELAGINRISYSGKAEPMEYKAFLELEDLPSEFRSMNITYILDDIVVNATRCNYGDDIDEGEFPEADTLEAGMYAQWNTDNLSDVSCDIEVIGESVRYLTSLAGIQLRDNNQSAILVDGEFKKEDVLSTELKASVSNDDKLLESWVIGIPDDGHDTHVIRYRAPNGIEAVSIKLENDADTIETTSMGQYLLFETRGNKVSFCVYDESKNYFEKYGVYCIIGLVTLVIIIFLIILKKKRKRKERVKNSSASNLGEKTDSLDDDVKDDLEIIDI